jgi:hypothetical protein
VRQYVRQEMRAEGEWRMVRHGVVEVLARQGVWRVERRGDGLVRHEKKRREEKCNEEWRSEHMRSGKAGKWK